MEAQEKSYELIVYDDNIDKKYLIVKKSICASFKKITIN